MENIVKNEARRDFLKVSGAVAGGLALGFYLPTGPRVARADAGGGYASPNAWIRIGLDNSITIMVARSEMGQDVYTSMPILVAEELEVDINKIKVEFAPPAEVYINALLGGQITGGSTSVRDAWEKLRKAGASARMMLVAAAADMWGVDASQCKAANGAVTGPGGKRANYGQLAAKAAQMEVPKDVPLKPSSQFKYVGNTKIKRLDTEAKVKGTAQFGIDTRVPGMLYAAVAMPPMIGGKVASYDDSRAKAMPGVRAVVQYSRGVAVVADSYWQAKKAKDLLLIRWDAGPNADLDMVKVWGGLEEASKQPGAVFREAGNVDAGMGTAVKTVKAEYRLPFLSHSPMEPMNTTADVRADKAIIITPTQFQQLIPHVVAGATGLKPEQVEVITTFLGGGFGRRVEVDYAIDAAEISKAVGAPVKMVWSREDDMMHDSYRPAGIYQLTAGLDANGKPVAMRFHSTSPSISARLFPSIVKDGIDPFAVEGIDNYPYETPNLKFTYQMHDTGVTPGYWRAVSHNLNAVALECFVDEMAHAAGKDPLQYRLDMLDMGSTKHQWSGLSAGVPVGARMKRVLEEVRSKSGWGKKLPAGRGMGVAVMEGYNTVIAMVAEVTVTPNYDVIIDKVTAVVDAGTLIHPDQALAQMQSTINFGQSACMWGEITVKNGAVEQNNFDMYRVARINEAPKVLDIHFIKSDSVPGGLGEPGTAVVQPAIGNAIFAACGKRCRVLPFTPENIRAS
ncbi:MAG TPA: molybdopterin cofactor-binding domain-containing protein [Burkholderiales bacterium]|jgi:isoquinoline 1-oxidoreductase beta subunit|nr:molybdopterin cofactor-binding domain-containing protein [Burkholderiales bacterium]